MQLENFWDLSEHGDSEHVAQHCKLGTSRERGSLTLTQFMKLISHTKIYRGKQSNNFKPLNDLRRPSERNNDSKKVNRELRDKIKWNQILVSYVYSEIKKKTWSK